MFLMGAVLFCGLITQVACGGGGSGDPKSTGYAITVTGTSGAMQHSTTFSLQMH
jgi:hypothetical protein